MATRHTRHKSVELLMRLRSRSRASKCACDVEQPPGGTTVTRIPPRHKLPHNAAHQRRADALNVEQLYP